LHLPRFSGEWPVVKILREHVLPERKMKRRKRSRIEAEAGGAGVSQKRRSHVSDTAPTPLTDVTLLLLPTPLSSRRLFLYYSDGGPHDFQGLTSENEKKQKSAGVMVTGGGAQAKK